MRTIAVMGVVLALAGLGTTAEAGSKEREAARRSGSLSGKVTLRDGQGGWPAESALVYVVEADPALWKDVKSARRDIQLRMKDKRFEPRTLAVLAGSEIAFPNADPLFHNAFSLSGKNKFDLGLYKDGASKVQKLKDPGLVRVFCNIHPKMSAFILVAQNPWFAQVESDGRFTIPGIAPGHYTVRAWHEKAVEATQEVEVKPGEPTGIDFDLDASGYKELPHKKKNGEDYAMVGGG